MKIALTWLSVPFAAIVASRLFIKIVDELFDSDASQELSKTIEATALSPAFFGQLHVFGAVVVLALIAAVLSGGAAFALADSVLRHCGAPALRRDLRISAVILAGFIAVWFWIAEYSPFEAAESHVGPFYPELALGILKRTVYAASPQADAIKHAANVAIGASLVAWAFAASAFAALVLAATVLTSHQFKKVFAFALALAVVPLVGSSAVLSQLYGLGSVLLPITNCPDLAGLGKALNSLATYYALMATGTIVATAGTTFALAVWRDNALATLLTNASLGRVITTLIAVLAPLVPPLLSGVLQATSP